MYTTYGDVFETIHDYFRGGALAPQTVARAIRSVAEYIEDCSEVTLRPGPCRQLAQALYLLAEEVMEGYARDARYWSRLPGEGPWYRNRPLLAYRR